MTSKVGFLKKSRKGVIVLVYVIFQTFLIFFTPCLLCDTLPVCLLSVVMDLLGDQKLPWVAHLSIHVFFVL